MTNGKIMDPKHIIGEKAIRFIQSILPPEWITRTMNPDYGIDLDVELFDYENKKCITMGEHLFFQIKGTEHPNYGKCTMMDNTINVIKFQLEVTELNLVERMGSAFPVILVLVDLVNKTAFQICLNDYIRKVLPIQEPAYRDQTTVVINIPIINKVSSEDITTLKWYGKGTKIYSMFHEMLVDIDDFGYMTDINELLPFARRFVEHYRNYEVLNSKDLWPCLGYIKDLLDNLYNNNFISDESIHLVQLALGYTENWESGEVFEHPLDYKGINAYLYAQKMSIIRLGETIRNYSGVFETYCREWFMPCLLLGVHD